MCQAGSTDAGERSCPRDFAGSANQDIVCEMLIDRDEPSAAARVRFTQMFTDEVP